MQRQKKNKRKKTNKLKKEGEINGKPSERKIDREHIPKQNNKKTEWR